LFPYKAVYNRNKSTSIFGWLAKIIKKLNLPITLELNLPITEIFSSFFEKFDAGFVRTNCIHETLIIVMCRYSGSIVPDKIITVNNMQTLK